MGFKTVSKKNIPSTLPINNTLIVGFILYYFHAPTWLLAIAGFFYTGFWILRISLFLTDTNIDIFADNNPTSGDGNTNDILQKTSFSERMKKMQKEQEEKKENKTNHLRKV